MKNYQVLVENFQRSYDAKPIIFGNRFHLKWKETSACYLYYKDTAFRDL